MTKKEMIIMLDDMAWGKMETLMEAANEIEFLYDATDLRGCLEKAQEALKASADEVKKSLEIDEICD
jgi:hypothetical protein